MREVLPGIHHWTAVHPNIGIPVSSYWIEPGGVLVDPLVPPDAGTAPFAGRATAIVLSNRHHYRQSDAFGVPVHVPRAGLHEFADGREVTPYDPDDGLPGGIAAIEIGGLCPDENALHLPGAGALVVADGVVRGSETDGPIGFVPDSLMDDPRETKRRLLAAYARVLAETEFTHLLLAHGGPLIGDGRARLQELVDAGGRTVEL